MGDSAGAHVHAVQASVFCADPQLSAGVQHHFAHPSSMQSAFRRRWKNTDKGRGGQRHIVYPAEVRAHPHTVSAVVEQAIQRVVRQGEGVGGIVGVVMQRFCRYVVNVKSLLAGRPHLVALHRQCPYKDVVAVLPGLYIGNGRLPRVDDA